MADRALSSMFGGLGEFIKLRRGFQQETVDRAQKAAAHDAAMKLALTQNRLGTAQAGSAEFRLSHEPEEWGMKKVDWLRGFGPEALTPAAVSTYVKDPSIASGLGDAISADLRRRAVTDRGAAAGVNLAEGQVSLQKSKLDATNEIAELIKNGTWDPYNNKSHHGLAMAAEKPGYATPTWNMTVAENNAGREHARKMVVLGGNISAGLQASAQKWADRGIPPESNPYLEREIEVHSKGIDDSAREAKANIARLNNVIAAAEAKIRNNIDLFGRAGNPEGAKQANAPEQTARDQAVLERNAAVADIQAAVTAVETYFDESLRAHPSVSARLKARLRTATAGLTAAPAGSTPVPDPNKPGVNNPIPRQ